MRPLLIAACVAILAACSAETGAGVDVVRCDYSAACVDVEQPQRLDITNVPTVAACDEMGGTYIDATCVDVDY